MRSHAILRGFRHDLGLDVADNLFLVITAAALMIVGYNLFCQGKTGQMSTGSAILIFGQRSRKTAHRILVTFVMSRCAKILSRRRADV